MTTRPSRRASSRIGWVCAILIGIGHPATAQPGQDELPPAVQSEELAEGVDLLRAGRPMAALALFDRVAAAEPDDPTIQLYRGMALLELDRAPEAIAALQRATAAAPGAAEAWLYLGSARRRTGDIEGALENFDTAAGEAGEDRELRGSVYHERGLAHAAANDLEPALAAFRMAVQVVPDRPRVHFDLGLASWRFGDEEAALQSLQRAEQLAPTVLEAPLTQALIHYQRGRNDEALRILEPLVAAAPDRGDVRYALGLAYKGSERIADAQAAFERALALGHDVAAVHYHLASLLHRVGELDGAARHLRTALQRDPRFIDAAIALGRVEIDRANLDAASDALTTAIDLAPESGEAHAAYGQVQLQRGEIATAITSLRRAMELDPDSRETIYALARAVQRRGAAGDDTEARDLLHRHRALEEAEIRRKEASARAAAALEEGRAALLDRRLDDADAAFSRALAEDPQLLAAQILAAFLTSVRGAPEQAVVELERLAGRDPTSADARYYLGMARLAGGQVDAAESAFRRALEIEGRRIDIRLVLGRLLIALERPADALEVLQPALAWAPELEALRDLVATARAALEPVQGG